MRELGTFADDCAQANGAAHDVMVVAQTLRVVLAARATEADDHGAFPEEGLREIRKSGLMGLVVDRQYGGMGASFSTMAEVAQILAEGCTSTAMIWAMHCQQVATLADHGGFALRESVLPRIAAGELYIASVTSERNKAGELLTAIAPLLRDEDNWIVERDAPVVTGGANADAYLATMRASPEANPSDVVLVFVERAQMNIRLQSGWSAMGMRSNSKRGDVDEGCCSSQSAHCARPGLHADSRGDDGPGRSHSMGGDMDRRRSRRISPAARPLARPRPARIIPTPVGAFRRAAGAGPPRA